MQSANLKEASPWRTSLRSDDASSPALPLRQAASAGPSCRRRLLFVMAGITLLAAATVAGVVCAAVVGEHNSQNDDDIGIEVLETFGGVELSREIFFGAQDNITIYSEYRRSQQQFFHLMLDVLKHRTNARHVLICKADSVTNVTQLVASATFSMTGIAYVGDLEYSALAFNGSGLLDRRGKAGGFENWIFRGHFQRRGMTVTFFNTSSTTVKSCVGGEKGCNQNLRASEMDESVAAWASDRHS